MPQKSSRFRTSPIVLSVVIAVMGSTQAHALKNKDFLKYTPGQKHVYYAGVFDTLGNIAVLNKAGNAKCIWGWLAEKPVQRKALLEKSFASFPEHAPTATILAHVERDCGQIGFLGGQN